MGIKILIIGLVVAAGTHLITMVVGKFVLKMDTVDVLGTQCGASTIIAPLNVLVEDNDRSSCLKTPKQQEKLQRKRR